ncbi:Dual specificity tyrosine-phosphorylation-regulated kinase 2, partial [Orchesella cincta]
WSSITEEVREGPKDRGILKIIQLQSSPSLLANTMSPQQALAQHGSKLTLFEKAEIVTFPQIYYLDKIGKILSTTSGPNDGYDDSEKFYIHRMHDHISYRYELLESLGKGDTSKFSRPWTTKPVLTSLGLHLTQLKNNVNVVEILDSFQFRNHSCIVFELLARNLSRLKFETCYKGFTPQQVKKFIIPVLQCLQGLSQKQIVHGDLNLENILLKQEYRDEIKVIDFGSSLFLNEEGSPSPYLHGCAYRAPELILGIEYGTPVDMWAVGCVVVELFTGTKTRSW